jgi:predicted flap endonuclease-1-like 5' DNA nuclease
LCDRGHLKIEGYNWHPAEEAKAKMPNPPPPAQEVTPDDLTDLVHIGTGRSKKLVEVGVVTFKDLVEMGEGELDSLLDITADQAAEIVEDALERMG